ncbi:sugar phosphate nucleotidyltransferase [Armatimonas sp.]|uniref:sugar phosphate nucleotidyltransferase n=1 Tax=Armatimonas sp. TaxID=1872638 RepID=UPI00374CC57C
MKAMVLGAGIGSRLDPLTRSLPKPAVPVVGKPVIGHILDHLKHYGVTEIMINVQYLGEKLMTAIGDGSAYGVKVSYSVEDELWGDAGGVKRCEAFFRDSDDDTFMVVGGDDLSDMDFGAIIAEHKAKNATATIGAKRVEDPSQFGIAVTDAENFITRFQEKPKPGEAFSNLANTGVYLFKQHVFDTIPAATFYGFGKDVLPALLAAGEPMLAVPTDAYWEDVGNLTIYRKAQRDCLDGTVKVVFPAGARVGENCFVCEGAHVHGTISDYTVVGKNAIVEAGAVVKNSVLWDGAIVRAGTYLENCVVGNGVTVSSTHGIFNAQIVEARRP